MIIELQIDSARFGESVREQMKRKLACQVGPDDFGPFSLIIDHYEYGPAEFRRGTNDRDACVHFASPSANTGLQVKTIEMTQVLRPFVVNWGALEAAQMGHPSGFLANLEMVFELSMDGCGSMRQLCLNLARVNGDPGLTASLRKRFSGTCIKLPIERILNGYLPPNLTLLNAHLALSSDNSILAIRMELWDPAWHQLTVDTAAPASRHDSWVMPPLPVDEARPVEYWRGFYAGIINNHLNHDNVRAGWSVFLDQFAISWFTHRMIADALRGKADPSLNWGPDARWWNNGGVSTVNLRAGVLKHDACDCLGQRINVPVGLTIDVTLTVPENVVDTLRIDAYMKLDPDGDAMFCCEATAALFWPVVGVGELDRGNVSLGEYYAGFLPFVALIGALMAGGEASHKADPPAGFTEVDPLHFRQEQHFTPGPDANFGTMTVDSAVALDAEPGLGASGLLLRGALHAREQPQPVLQTMDVDGFRWGKAGHCSRRLAANTLLSLDTENPGDWFLLDVCSVTALDDNFHVFHLETRRDGQRPPAIAVQVDYLHAPPEYWDQGPYPCRLLLLTTAGVRLVTIPAPEGLSAAEVAEKQRKLAFEYVNDCYIPQRKLFDELQWPLLSLIEQPGLHVFQVRTAGLQPGEQVQLVGVGGETLTSGFANAAGAVRLAAAALLDGQQMTLTLRRSGQPIETPGLTDGDTFVTDDGTNEPPNVTPALLLRQSRLALRGQVDLPDVATHVALEHRGGLPTLVAGSGGLVELYDISNPARPERRGSAVGSGLRGLTYFARQTVYWGDEGLGLDPPGPRRPFARCEGPAVRRAAASGDRLYALEAGGLRAFDEQLCQVAQAALPAAQDLIVVAPWLVAANDEGLNVFRLADTGDLTPASSFALTHIAALAVPVMDGGGDTVQVTTNDGSQLMQILPTGELCPAGEHPAGAWLARAMFLDGALAVLSENGRTVELYAIEESVTTE